MTLKECADKKLLPCSLCEDLADKWTLLPVGRCEPWLLCMNKGWEDGKMTMTCSEMKYRGPGMQAWSRVNEAMQIMKYVMKM